jgi:hypothetical protein
MYRWGDARSAKVWEFFLVPLHRRIVHRLDLDLGRHPSLSFVSWLVPYRQLLDRMSESLEVVSDV